MKKGATKDATFRVRVARADLARIKRIAKARGEPASAWVRRLVEQEARREEASLQLLRWLDEAPDSGLTDEEAMELANEAVDEVRRRQRG